MDSKKTVSLILLKHPYIVIVLIIVVLVIGMFFSFTVTDEDASMDDETKGSFYTQCTEGEINYDKFDSQFENAGAFTGLGRTFIEVAQQNKIDPVLLASIAFHETGYGNSNMVKTRNNPGGLYNSSAGTFFTYPTLADGLDAMAGNLFKLYISQGLVSIADVGNKYAPIGVANDPTNLNANWIPTVSKIANDFGGLTMNCEVISQGSGEFAHPSPGSPVTSQYGTRTDPITGVTSTHGGIDFGCRIGAPIYSALGGTVAVAVHSGEGGGFGHHAVIKHDGYYTTYGHMTDVSVNVGDKVDRGQQIGTCGSTGRSTGPHLHFEVSLGIYTQRQDPAPYLALGEKK